MSKTFKDKPEQYRKIKRKPKEDRRFESTKGRKNKPIKKNLEDYFI